MASTSRRLLPETLTYPTYYYDDDSPAPASAPSPAPAPAPALSPAPSPLPSDANACPFPCDPSCPSDSICPWNYYSPPPPPPSFLSPPYNPSRGSLRLSTPGIIAVSLVSTLFLLTVYLILLARSRRNRPNNRGPHQGPPPTPGDGSQWGEEEWNQNQAMVHPIWLINTVGLQPAVIGSIAVCEYKKGEGLMEGDYCSICLSDFEEGENLRLLPKCSHAFHIPCIDTWLRSHTNCPLCRAPILSPMPASNSIAVLELAGSGSSGGEDVRENTEGGDTAMADTGDSSGVAEGSNGDEGLNDKSGVEEVEIGASVGRRSVSMDGNVSIFVSMDGEGNRRGRVGGVRSLPGSGRFCRPGSDC